MSSDMLMDDSKTSLSVVKALIRARSRVDNLELKRGIIVNLFHYQVG